MFVKILTKKYNELGRLPKKNEFAGMELTFVKSVLGPLPRAFEAAGLKGLSSNGARVSEKHCGFIINDGTACA